MLLRKLAGQHANLKNRNAPCSATVDKRDVAPISNKRNRKQSAGNGAHPPVVHAQHDTSAPVVVEPHNLSTSLTQHAPLHTRGSHAPAAQQISHEPSKNRQLKHHGSSQYPSPRIPHADAARASSSTPSTSTCGEFIQPAAIVSSARTPCAVIASSIAHRLREKERAKVHVTTDAGLVPSLKALTLANSFLQQHQAGLTFCPHSILGNVRERMGRSYLVDVWKRRMEEDELMKVHQRVEREAMMFTQHIRVDKTNRGFVNPDQAFSIAESLIHRVSLELNQGKSQAEWLMSTELTMSPVIFYALALVERQLQQNKFGVRIECTTYRHTLNPRPDDYDGFIWLVRAVRVNLSRKGGVSQEA